MKTIFIIFGVFVALGLIAAGWVYVYWDKAVPIAALAINYVRYFSAPAGTLTTEQAAVTDAKPSSPLGAATANAGPLVADATPGAAPGNWPDRAR